MAIYTKTQSLWGLQPEQQQAALAAGCIDLEFGQLGEKAGHILLAHSTVGWIGVYRIQPKGKFPVRIKRFQDFGRALRCAQREDRT